MESHTEFESKAKAHSQKTSRSHLIQNRVWGGGGGGSYKLGQLTSMIWAIYLLPFKLKEDLKRQFFFFFFLRTAVAIQTVINAYCYLKAYTLRAKGQRR